MAEKRELDAVLPLPEAAFHILVALAEGDRHGYAILQEVAERTDGRFRLGPGTLDRPIQRPGPEPEPSVRALGDLLEDRVAVPVSFRQRHEDVERRLREREDRVELSLLRHRNQLYPSWIYPPRCHSAARPITRT